MSDTEYQDFGERFLRHETRFGVTRAALEKLPVIDLTPFTSPEGTAEARLAVGRALRTACIDIGFFYLVGHGFPANELDELDRWGRRFFDLPMDEKMTLHRAKHPGNHGYVGTGGNNPEVNPDKQADIKERFVMARDVIPGEPEEGRFSAGKSNWPAPGVIDGYEAFMRQHIDRRKLLTQQLVRAFALSLDLPEAFFDEEFKYPGVNFLLNYYPPMDVSKRDPNQWNFSPHSDYGAFTLLSQDEQGGLEARNSAGEWIDVPPLKGALVVNIGDMFAMWTNDLYVSTLHRVVNGSGAARMSGACFTHPQGRTMVKCLETCHGPGNPPRYQPVLAHEYASALVAQSNKRGRPGVSERTAERLRA
jgi:isopenicillin N synthase-like dioxygenase